jgi:hypothetical protein
MAKAAQKKEKCLTTEKDYSKINAQRGMNHNRCEIPPPLGKKEKPLIVSFFALAHTMKNGFCQVLAAI